MQAAGTTGAAEHSGIPCAMGLQLLRDLPGDRLSCPHRRRDALPHPLRLDLSIGRPGPRDL